MAKERVGYPTQKPLSLLNRIISAASNPGDTVLDPFLGSGTSVISASRLNRRFIGIDSNANAIHCTRKRLLQDKYVNFSIHSGFSETFSPNPHSSIASRAVLHFSLENKLLSIDRIDLSNSLLDQATDWQSQIQQILLSDINGLIIPLDPLDKIDCSQFQRLIVIDITGQAHPFMLSTISRSSNTIRAYNAL